ncbi:hypothetical protein D9613_003251 [Agrocybe pediades]|uniref:Enoyl reductase (ER) domain-containing protein n=1 Tax=Agrocybe pediades TaxID=84607 RepID=A0A8H4QPZ0_9AGAR|nr:hypothetical protein D9613_003251 [Agrocybe pediades]
MTSIQKTQRAWTVIRRGTPDNAAVLNKEWPVPQDLRPGEVLVKVQAAALNPLGWKLMKFIPGFISWRPYVAEHDFSGVIVNANGTKFKDGDPVFGWIDAPLQRASKQGTLAEYLKIPAEHIAVRPPNLTPVQAAGITLASLTAYQALKGIADLQPDQTLFVNGGSTAVGIFAIQYAKAIGAKVVATASGKNEAFVRGLGADEFIDYMKTGPLHTYLEKNAPSTKYQVIFETVGFMDPSLFTHSAKYLANDGVFISTGPLPTKFNFSALWDGLRTAGAVLLPAWLGSVNRKWKMVMVENSVDDLQELQKLFANGTLKPVVDSVYEFEDAHKAYERILSSRATGKIVVKVDPTAQ